MPFLLTPLIININNISLARSILPQQNDYLDYLLANAGNNQMPTLNRDIQQLNLASNNISSLGPAEFYRKKFTNLQKIYLAANQLSRVHSSAFHKLTGLIELDLSENLLASLASGAEDSDSDGDGLAAPVDYQRQPEGASAREARGLAANTELAEEEGAAEEEEDDGETTRTIASKKSQRIFKSAFGGQLGQTFLRDLSQLRQLNLASNQLKRIEEFTFSPLTQLRQLILSR